MDVSVLDAISHIDVHQKFDVNDLDEVVELGDMSKSLSLSGQIQAPPVEDTPEEEGDDREEEAEERYSMDFHSRASVLKLSEKVAVEVARMEALEEEEGIPEEETDFLEPEIDDEAPAEELEEYDF
jgi:hypothetical protein